MPQVDRLQVLSHVRKHSPETVTIMMTGYASLDSAIEAVQLGAYEYLLKPTEVPQLKLAVKRSLERKRFSELDALYSSSISIAAQPDHDAAVISRQIADAVCRVLRIAEACVVVLNRQQFNNCPPGFAEVLSRAEVLMPLARGEAITAANNIASVTDWAERYGLSSVALVPGSANERLVCVLCTHNGQQPYEFHASSLRFLRALSGQAALALENASLIQELKANNQALLAANRKLRELDTLKSQFLGVATHELRT